jgi:hypothetical protein
MTTDSKTVPNVFIIESLSFEDEQNNRFEGKILSQILHLLRKNSAYFYVQNKQELEKAIMLFKVSNYRYLHISCHGSRTALHTTLEEIDFVELAKSFSRSLEGKRLFLSACYIARDKLADHFFEKTGCLSIIGLDDEINIDKAAVIWATFYYSVFENDANKMDRETIKPALRAVRAAFNIDLNYYAINERLEKGYQKLNF